MIAWFIVISIETGMIFWEGNINSVITRQLSDVATGIVLQYTVFEQLKDFLLRPEVAVEVVGTGKAVCKSSPKVLTAFQAFLVGALAKTTATVLTYPAIRY